MTLRHLNDNIIFDVFCCSSGPYMYTAILRTYTVYKKINISIGKETIMYFSKVFQNISIELTRKMQKKFNVCIWELINLIVVISFA